VKRQKGDEVWPWLSGSAVAGASAVGAFAQDPSGGSAVRQKVDAMSNVLGGIIGILFVVVVMRGLMKRKKRPPQGK
jgi:hypothetical protein